MQRSDNRFRRAIAIFALLFPASLAYTQVSDTLDWNRETHQRTLIGNTTYYWKNATRQLRRVVWIYNPASYSVTWQGVKWANDIAPAQAVGGKATIWVFDFYGDLVGSVRATNISATQPSPADVTAPNAITDLTTGSPTPNSITLTFRARGDRNALNQLVRATAYDIRYSTNPIWAGDTVRPGGGSSTVTFDVAASDSPASATSHTLPITVGAGSNRYLDFGASYFTATSEVPDSVKRGGIKFTAIGSAFSPTSGYGVSAWRLLNPATGAGDITVYWPSAKTPTLGATAWSGINQSNPIGGTTTNSGNSGTVTVTIGSTSGEVVRDVVRHNEYITVGAGQTQRWNLPAKGNGPSGAGSSEPGAASVPMTWTTGIPGEWATIGWAIKPATGNPDTIPFGIAFQAINEPAPADSGVIQTFIVGGLNTPLMAGTQYWFMMKVSDAAGNISAVSNLATGTTTSGAAGSTVKYVLSTGNDNNNGDSPSTAWLTIGKANVNLSTTIDTVLIGNGTYADAINPVNAGTQATNIVYRNYLNETPLVSGVFGIQLSTADSNIVIDGITVQATGRIADLDGSIRITVTNCTLRGGSNATGGAYYETFRMNNTKYCKIQNNFLDRQDPDNPAICDLGLIGDGIAITGSGSERNLIEGNTVTGCSHLAITQPYGPPAIAPKYNVVRNNIARLNHSAYTTGVRSLFEGNVAYHNGRLICDRRGSAFQSNNADSSIIRFNVFYDDTTGPGSSGHFGDVTIYGVSEFGLNWHVRGMRTYNNTIYAGTDQATSKYVFWLPNWNSVPVNSVIRGNHFRNNIFVKGTPHPNDNIAPVVVELDDGSVTTGANDAIFDANIVRKFAAGDVVISYYGSNGIVNYTLAQAKAAKPSQWLSSNIESDPLFANETAQGSGKDFRLQVGSPAINAGVHLTTTTNSGTSSTNLIVTDASYFMDGWGIVTADSIAIGSGNLSTAAKVGISAINYSTNTITLNAAKTWAIADKVWYWRYDRVGTTAPHMGAKGESLPQ